MEYIVDYGTGLVGSVMEAGSLLEVVRSVIRSGPLPDGYWLSGSDYVALGYCECDITDPHDSDYDYCGLDSRYCECECDCALDQATIPIHGPGGRVMAINIYPDQYRSEVATARIAWSGPTNIAELRSLDYSNQAIMDRTLQHSMRSIKHESDKCDSHDHTYGPCDNWSGCAVLDPSGRMR